MTNIGQCRQALSDRPVRRQALAHAENGKVAMKIFLPLLLLILMAQYSHALEIVSPQGGFIRAKLFSLEVRNAPGLMRMSFNGVPVFAKAQGGYNRELLASRGWNTITVSDAKNLMVSDTVGFYADVPPTALKVILYWDTDNTDLDLHVLEPDGTECYYGNRTTPLGGRLDVDVTTGYGPEVYTLSDNASAGVYRFFIRFYGGEELTEATVVAIQNEGTSREKRTAYSLMLTQKGTKIDVGQLEMR